MAALDLDVLVTAHFNHEPMVKALARRGLKHRLKGLPGIEIAGEEGRPIVATAGGEVVYSGNGLIGYGELIIIKHSERMLSAYAHNR